MITKERLEELVRQGATIYFINSNFVDCKDSKYHGVEVCNNYVSILYGGHWHDIDYENIFETEEDAKWELEMTATRTETLKLPKWEEFCKFDELIPTFRFSFISKDKENCSLYLFNGICEIDPKEIILWNQNIDDKIIFEKVATKENYIEACKLCLRLFKGEEV